MKKVGEVLKEAREKKKTDLSQVEADTKIRAKILADLENEDWSQLPSETYVKGLIKNYGEYLGLSSEHLLALFRRQYKTQKSTDYNFWSTSAIRFFPKIISAGGIMLVLIVVVVSYLIFQFFSLKAAPTLEIASPTDGAKFSQSTIKVVGKTEPEIVVEVNGQQVSVAEDGSFTAELTAPSGISEIEVVALDKSGRMRKKVRTIEVSP